MKSKSGLENKTATKFTQVVDQFQQYIQEKSNLEHYFTNLVRITLGIPIINYQVISHKNALVHSSPYHRII
ncbi:MAG: hypothetical protein WC796_03955 [Candidatus Pacearchaeota archaeon]|jgi:hypothetical protein